MAVTVTAAIDGLLAGCETRRVSSFQQALHARHEAGSANVSYGSGAARTDVRTRGIPKLIRLWSVVAGMDGTSKTARRWRAPIWPDVWRATAG